MKENKKKLSLFAKISLVVFLLSEVLLYISRTGYGAADFLNGTVSHYLRYAMALFGEFFPFSLFQLLIFLIIPVAAVLIIAVVRAFSREEGRVRLVANILAVALILYSGNSLALGIGYGTTPIEEKMGFELTEVNEERLTAALVSLRDEVNLYSEKIEYSEGKSVPGYTLSEASAKICESFSDIEAEYGFPASFSSTAKSASTLNILSYLRLGGIYTYYTGEANVNTSYPEFDSYFTAAHELSHQRGIMRENEANFMAYLALSRSEDVYLRYSAAMNMLVYVGNALWQTAPETYREIMSGLSDNALSDLRASSEITRKYGQTLLADLSNAVNDLFLKSNGTDGTVTYGRVVTLYVGYLYSNK